MKNFVAFLLLLGVIGLASAINHKSRAKRQGYGDLVDDAQPQQPQTQPTYQQPQPQPTRPTYQQPQTPSQPNYPSTQYGGGGGRPGGSGQYPTGGGGRPGGSGQYQTGGGSGGQHQTGGGSGGQYQTGGGSGQYQTGGGSGQYQTGGGSGQYRPGSGSGQSHDYQDYDSGANSLPGTPGRDYPTYGPQAPETSFACSSAPYVPGYYANTEYGCQVWHICEQGGKLSTFLCPNGTIFNQKYLVCDWWYNVNCGESTNFYNVNAQLYQVPAGGYGGGHDQAKGSGFGNVGGQIISGNAGNPFGGQGGSVGGSFPGQGRPSGGSFPGQGGSGTYQGPGGVGGYTGQTGGGSVGGVGGYTGQTGGGSVGGVGGYTGQTGGSVGGGYGSRGPAGGSQQSQYPSGQTASTSGPAAPSYPAADAPSGGY